MGTEKPFKNHVGCDLKVVIAEAFVKGFKPNALQGKAQSKQWSCTARLNEGLNEGAQGLTGGLSAKEVGLALRSAC